MKKRIVLDIETAAKIERGVKDNGRNIADNSLRLMKIDDDIGSVKEDTRSMSAIISEMQSDIHILKELNLEVRENNLAMKENIIEQRKANHEIKLLLDKLIDNHANIRHDIDNLKSSDKEIWGDRKVGVV